MTKRVIEHEIKLEKSVKLILAVLAFGLLAHLFAPAFSVKDALAELSGGTQQNPLYIDFTCRFCR